MLSEKLPKDRVSYYRKQVIVFAAQLALFHSFSLISFGFPDSIRVDYVVDVRPTNKNVLTVRAQVDGLPRGEITLRFAEEDDTDNFSRRIAGLSIQTAQGENNELEIDGCRVT